MDASTARTLVRIISVLNYIGAGIAIIAGIIFLVAGSALTTTGGFGVLFSVFGTVAGVVLLGLGVLAIFLGYGLWHFRNWARIITIILVALELLACIGAIINASVGTGIFGLIFDCAVIWLLVFSKDTIALFRQTS